MKRFGVSRTLITATATATLVLIGGSLTHASGGVSADPCPAGDVCAYTGPGESGTEFKIAIPADSGPPTCFDGPPNSVIVSAENRTNRPVEFSNGTCANQVKPDPLDKLAPNTKGDLPHKVDWTVRR
jgi:hypothetical protein